MGKRGDFPAFKVLHPMPKNYLLRHWVGLGLSLKNSKWHAAIYDLALKANMQTWMLLTIICVVGPLIDINGPTAVCNAANALQHLALKGLVVNLAAFIV